MAVLMRRSCTPRAYAYRVENFRKQHLVCHSFSVCVCTCRLFMKSFNHALPLPLPPSPLSASPLSASHMLRVFVCAPLVCFRLLLLGKHAPFS